MLPSSLAILVGDAVFNYAQENRLKSLRKFNVSSDALVCGLAYGCLYAEIGKLTFELPRFSINMGIRAVISGMSSVGYFKISGIISYKIALAFNIMSASASETVRQVFRA